ncbi:unnamed protein product [Calicophoron daubneyi]|uniref:Uncharacterized protein n=1 Tax=Calicophoron daubneyi TaxID=300641 RepID=A0AAV2T2R1_CALDB
MTCCSIVPPLLPLLRWSSIVTWYEQSELPHPAPHIFSQERSGEFRWGHHLVLSAGKEFSEQNWQQLQPHFTN